MIWLYMVRAGFVQQGSTLGAWCRENNVWPSNARTSLYGSWDGPKAHALRKRLIDAAGLDIELDEAA